MNFNYYKMLDVLINILFIMSSSSMLNYANIYDSLFRCRCFILRIVM
jgi:hypothetical protein